MLDESPLPMMMAAAGTAAEFCSRPEVWSSYEEWLREGIDGEPDETVTREFLSATARVMLMIIQGMEQQIISERFTQIVTGMTGDQTSSSP